MIPSVFSTDGRALWEGKVRSPDDMLRDYELGSTALSNTVGGLLTHQWVAYYDGSTQEVRVYREDSGESSSVVLLSRPGILCLTFCFDQNMRPVVAWQESSGVYLALYDDPSSSYVPTLVHASAKTPCLTLDDKRSGGIPTSDVLLSYIRDGRVMCRVQRENFSVEHDLAEAATDKLISFSMTRELYLQWRLAS